MSKSLVSTLAECEEAQALEDEANELPSPCGGTGQMVEHVRHIYDLGGGLYAYEIAVDLDEHV